MIKDISKGTVLAERTKFLNNIFSKGVGLMFSRKAYDLGLIFTFKTSKGIMVHNFFVFYSLDLIFLDEDKKVVEIKEDFKPFTYYKPKSNFKYMVEVVAGRVKTSRTNVGDKISF